METTSTGGIRNHQGQAITTCDSYSGENLQSHTCQQPGWDKLSGQLEAN